MLHIKKIVLLLLFSGFVSAASAQSGTNMSDNMGMDNTIQPFSGTSPFRKFSIGVNAGVMTPSVLFGGSNDFAKNKATLGYGANLRYQLNHYLAIHADYLGGKVQGTQDDKSFAQDRPVQSFETKLKSALSISGELDFDNINWLKQKTHVVPYVTVGIGVLSYSVDTTSKGGTTAAYTNFSKKHPLFVPVGLGLKFNLSDAINLDLGYRMNFVDGDEFDGSPYWLPGSGSSKTHFDKFSYGFLGIEFALGKKTQPQLLFDNPVARLSNNLQTQIDTVKQQVQKLSNDADGDGVADMFDKEPNTPAGCPVDSHGVSRDTDGDGVPDCKDKELITPTQCQPVDADGVGKCPEPDCCKAIRDTLAAMNACNLNLPSINFRGNRSTLTTDAKAMLANVASQMKNSANCAIVVTGYPAATKASQSMANRRVAAIKAYLTETEGISADRIDTNVMVGGGDVNTIDIHTK